MKRTYALTLEVEGPDDTDLDLLDYTVGEVVQWSTAKEAIDTGLFGASDRLSVDVTSLRLDTVMGTAVVDDLDYIEPVPLTNSFVDACAQCGSYEPHTPAATSQSCWRNIAAAMSTPKMMPGQPAYTPAEYLALTAAVDEAAEYDPGEGDETRYLDELADWVDLGSNDRSEDATW